jgi:hypothetical protein
MYLKKDVIQGKVGEAFGLSDLHQVASQNLAVRISIYCHKEGECGNNCILHFVDDWRWVLLAWAMMGQFFVKTAPAAKKTTTPPPLWYYTKWFKLPWWLRIIELMAIDIGIME